MTKSIAPQRTLLIDACVFYLGFSYKQSGFNPLKAAAQDSLADPDLPYCSNRMAHFYQSFAPSSVADAHLLDEMDAPFSAQLCARSQIHVYPWALKHKRLASGQCQQYGPAPDAGPHHFEVIRTLCASITRRGYRRWSRWGNGLRGLWLLNGDRKRFILREGQQPVAVLAALGHPMTRPRSHKRFGCTMWTTDRWLPTLR